MQTSTLQADLHKKNKKNIQKYNLKTQLDFSPSKPNPKLQHHFFFLMGKHRRENID